MLMNVKVSHMQATTVICDEHDHYHSDPHIDILKFQCNGHDVTLESVRGSNIYTVQIDNDLELTGLPGSAVDDYIYRRAGANV